MFYSYAKYIYSEAILETTIINGRFTKHKSLFIFCKYFFCVSERFQSYNNPLKTKDIIIVPLILHINILLSGRLDCYFLEFLLKNVL